MKTDVINTSKFSEKKKVNIDGMIWDVKVPGGGGMAKLSKVQRRIDLLDKKIESGKYTEKDVDLYDELEDYMFSFIKGMFNDSTKNNSQVEKWFDETPMHIIMKVFDELTERANAS